MQSSQGLSDEKSRNKIYRVTGSLKEIGRKETDRYVAEMEADDAPEITPTATDTNSVKVLVSKTSNIALRAQARRN